MTAIKYVVDLTHDEREYLLGLTQRGKSSARKVKRALMLLKAHEDWTDHQIAKSLNVGTATVGRTRKRFVEEGLDALDERRRLGAPRRIDGKQQAHIIAMACSDAPEGHARWTLRLLADKAVELDIVESISHEGVRKILKKTASSPGRKSSGVSPR